MRPSSRICEELGEARGPARRAGWPPGTRAVGEGEPVGVGRVPAHLPVRRLHLEARACRTGTMIVLISPGPVRAVTVTKAVISVPELVMNAFSPLITHSPAASSSTAVVRVPPASLPASGSVRPKPPSVRPAHRSGSQRLLLLLGAEAVDRVGAEADARLERDGHRVVDPGQLLDGDAEHREVAAAAAVLLGERDAEQPELAHRRARRRPGSGGRGPTPRRAARSRPRRSRARPCAARRAPR